MVDVDWNPDRYLETMRAAVPGYSELQEEVVLATEGLDVRDALELGVGTGETALRLLERHPKARWTALDGNESMLARARERLPQAELHLRRLEDPLPGGPFDLVVSALAVHHLDAAGKRDLFGRIANILRAGGRFVLGDVVVPERAEDAVIEIDWVVDLPDAAEDQLTWLGDVGLEAELTWKLRDLAVLRARKP